MANDDNLIPFSKRTESEQREIRHNGGVASGESRRKKKTMAQLATAMLTAELSSKEKESIKKRYGEDVGEEATVAALVIAGQVKSAMNGNTRAFDSLMEMSEREEEREKKEEEERRARIMSNFHLDLEDVPCAFHELIHDVRKEWHSEYCISGGRGSTKSSTIAKIIPELIKNNHDVHAVVVRKVGNTLRDSVYSKLKWAINKMGLEEQFNFTVSPLEITYKPTGQKIYFRGADKPEKIKSISPEFGYIGVLWFEEFDQFAGTEEIRNIIQSCIRGGNRSWIFESFNPPISKNNWANAYADTPKDGMLSHKSTYLDVVKHEPDWLGEPFIQEAEHLKKVNPTAYEHEYMGNAVGLGTEIFKFLEIRTITDEEIARQERIYQGQDWGWMPDPKAFIRLSYNHSNETIMLLDEDGGSCIRVKDMAEKIKEKGYNDYEIYCGVDEQEHINDYRDLGLPARPAIVTPGSVKRTHEWLQCRKIVIDPARTPKAYKEFTEYEHDVDKNGEVIDGYPDRNNHWIDAVRYATSPLSMKRGEKA